MSKAGKPPADQEMPPCPALPPGIDPKALTAADVSVIAEAGSKNGTFQCALCQKKFGYKNGLIRHVRLTHVGEKPYECNICNRRFGYKHILMEHQNLHFGNRPYACTMCDKKFAARSNLIQHRMVHKRPFNCGMCSKRFDKEDQLKKHMFAHPQALLSCNFCPYAATSQKDLNKHMTDCHNPHVMETRARVDSTEGDTEQSEEMTPVEQNGGSQSRPPTADSVASHHEVPVAHHEVTVGQQDIPVTHPEVHIPNDTSPHGTLLYSPRSLSSMSDHHSPKGHRVETICNQLSTGLPPQRLGGIDMPQGHYSADVHIKKEVDDYDSGCGSSNPHKSPISEGSDIQHPYNSPDLSRTMVSSAYSHPPISSISPPPALSVATSSPLALGLPTSLQQSFSALPTSLSQTSALPSIHEVFARRPQRMPAAFANFGLPAILAGDTRFSMPHPDSLPLTLMSPPPAPFPNPSPTGQTAVVSASTGGRPTAQLPPITQVLRTQQAPPKEENSLYSASMSGIPGLDDILTHYINMGRLFKCQHCNILFFERGMYFLHSSLHGHSDPWECSICHKVCTDKNEFTLHFVNQQHTL